MFVPSARLISFAAIVLVPFALVVAVAPSASTLAAAGILGFVLVAIIDAGSGAGRLRDLEVSFPATVRLTKDRAGQAELVLKSTASVPRRLRLGLAWPKEFGSQQEEMEVQLPEKTERATLRWPVTPVMRGSFGLGEYFVEALSPLGLWSMRTRRPIRCELRVYPNLQSDRKSVAAVFLNRGSHGSHVIRAMGKGRDFEKLRDYLPGDGMDEIHWKATAKRGRPVTKIFQVERTQEVYAIVDASRLTARTEVIATGAADGAVRIETHLERFVNAALILGVAAEQQGDHFGLITFSDRVHKFVRAKNGAQHFNVCRDALYTLQPRSVSPDFDELTGSIRLRLRKRSLLVFLTALDDPVLAEGFLKNIELLARQHLVIVTMIVPPEVRPLFSDDAVATVDGIYRDLGNHVRWQKLREIEKQLGQRGVRFVAVANGDLVARVVSNYAGIKQRQLL